MSRCIDQVNGINIFEHINPPAVKIDSLTAAGMVYRFYQWIREGNLPGPYDYSIEDVDNNLSGIRDGCRLDLMDDYRLSDELYISYLFYINGCTWAALVKDGEYYGDIEISC